MTTEKSLRNLTNTPLTTDLSDYFDWLSKNYGISRADNIYQSTTTASISHKNSNEKIKIHSSIFQSFVSVDYSPCLSAPCIHNSTCVIQSEHRFQCICAPAFIGIYCEIGKFSLLFYKIVNQTFLIYPEILNIAHFRKFSWNE
jgi:hypothetical protein